ncbi:DMT family transporter [Plantibacter sp. ME-Dv--P-122b]|uniref:DMT family transporter n=1 Tax=Plantibacter sp. ME-Dv--P-122b TaxID=3040300 RepID=UPI00254A9DFC|nr:DMT family transporter [Plantibacter sp. ME-Dv--P-122b]
MKKTQSWMLYAGLLVLFWGVWGAFSSLPITLYGYPDEMVYVIWAVVMIIPAVFALRGQTFDRRPRAAVYGLLIGLTGAGGQLLLFNALSTGPAYLIFPIISISPAITVIMAVILLRERLNAVAIVGLVAALAAIVLFSVSSGSAEGASGPWLIIAILVSIAWGVQAFFMRKAATIGVNDATTFSWMAISGLILTPFAIIAMGGLPLDAPWQAPVLTAGTQLLNAVGALFLVMALSRGKASVVAPTTNALAPVLTILVSLVVYQTLPSIFGTIAIVLALIGSTLMVYSDERRGEAVPPALCDGARATANR